VHGIGLASETKQEAEFEALWAEITALPPPLDPLVGYGVRKGPAPPEPDYNNIPSIVARERLEQETDDNVGDVMDPDY
jgi:hypothetical protein